MLVAYQGRPGAYSELAAQRLLGLGIATLPCASFAAVVRQVTAGVAVYGILPVYNSLAGKLPASCRLLARASLRIIDETVLGISHALLAPPGTGLHTLREVHSHPVALRQCRQFLARHPHLYPRAVADTAGALETIMARALPDTAAIAGAHTAALYGAVVLAEKLEDTPANYTTFILFTI